MALTSILYPAGAVGFPCVVKPADGAGSVGVTVVTGPEGLEQAWQAARAARVMYGLPRDERVPVQEYVGGSEFSVQSVTHHGVSTHLCITRLPPLR
ncbi:ATP-grasp domain-containing protein [Streptomyces mirabilis]|uniref:ATP-grasp domain-containing protein n=1 Tax=Streptomyces mirabilis TaxID=68239 RepID=UPI00340A70BA